MAASKITVWSIDGMQMFLSLCCIDEIKKFTCYQKRAESSQTELYHTVEMRLKISQIQET